MTATANVTVKNKRLKMSPGGLITLPVSARRAIGMAKGKGAVGSITVEGNTIVVSAEPVQQGDTVRISPGGTVALPEPAKRLLAATKTRHFWLEAFDGSRRAVLHPFG